MRLINLKSLELCEFFGGNLPPYFILSHTWEDDEVSFQDLQKLTRDQLECKAGWRKIVNFCKVALQESAIRLAATDSSQNHRLKVMHAWVDTCCINKESSAELSEAINSMFRWYRDSECCFAYLSDISSVNGTAFSNSSTPRSTRTSSTYATNFTISRWFTRGWTLQELLAPSEVLFRDKDWNTIGTLREQGIAAEISRRTSIETDFLVEGRSRWQGASAATKMSWAANRTTTRPEDMAYSLLGLFDVQMPILYGEGENSFIRLQEEILKEYDDLSLLAWSKLPENVDFSKLDRWGDLVLLGALATHPSQFRQNSAIISFSTNTASVSISNKGLEITAPFLKADATTKPRLVLPCYYQEEPRNLLVLTLERNHSREWQYHRVVHTPRNSQPDSFGPALSLEDIARLIEDGLQMGIFTDTTNELLDSRSFTVAKRSMNAATYEYQVLFGLDKTADLGSIIQPAHSADKLSFETLFAGPTPRVNHVEKIIEIRTFVSQGVRQCHMRLEMTFDPIISRRRLDASVRGGLALTQCHCGGERAWRSFIYPLGKSKTVYLEPCLSPDGTGFSNCPALEAVVSQGSFREKTTLFIYLRKQDDSPQAIMTRAWRKWRNKGN